MPRTASRRFVLAVLLVALIAVSSAAALSSQPSGAEPILGRWQFPPPGGGIFEFVERSPGTFVNTVIQQRKGVVCTEEDSQVVLTKTAERVYEGTWEWFNLLNCAPAGKGPATLTVAPNGKTARVVAEPPPGLEVPAATFTLSWVDASAVGMCRGLRPTIVGTNGPDTLIGTPRGDVIIAKGGADIVRGRGGNDLICLGGGADLGLGGGGDDLILGQGGNDRIRGGGGRDDLRGGAGGDDIRGQGGNDSMRGEGGRDKLNGNAGRDVANGGPGPDICLNSETVRSC